MADTEAIPSYQILEKGSATVQYQRHANSSFFQPSSENHNSSFTPSKDNELIDQNSSSESEQEENHLILNEIPLRQHFNKGKR